MLAILRELHPGATDAKGQTGNSRTCAGIPDIDALQRGTDQSLSVACQPDQLFPGTDRHGAQRPCVREVPDPGAVAVLGTSDRITSTFADPEFFCLALYRVGNTDAALEPFLEPL